MQAPTHILTGVLIEELTRKSPRLPFKPLIIITSCILSHMILDKFARLTYHPSKPLYKDAFWVFYHASLLIVTIVSLRLYWKDHKLAIIASVFPDIDWIIFRPITALFPELEALKGPVTHKLLEDVLSVVLPIQWFDTLPDWNLNKPTVLIEMIVLSFLFLAIQHTANRGGRQGTVSQKNILSHRG